MLGSDEGYSFTLSVDDFDKSVLPPEARTPGTDEFIHAVNEFFQKEFASFGGKARIIVDAKTIEVSWQSAGESPMQAVKNKLEHREFPEAINLLEILRRHQPNDHLVLYNLGMALSDTGQPDRAEQHLRRAVEANPDHVNSQVALAVALIRQNRTREAVPILREAVAKEPNNPWAYRNLGGCLLQMGESTEAEKCLRRAVELNLTDQQAVFGLAQALHANGDLKQADAYYLKTIELDERTLLAESARQIRTEFAEKSFQRPGIERPDAVMYCFGALQKYGKMKKDEIEKIGFEIALLGRSGLDTSDATEKYRLRTLPGQFSGLHLLCPGQ